MAFGFRKLFKPDPSGENTLEWVMRQFWRISTSLEEIETQLGGGSQEHGDLTGLADDDHLQYLHKDITRHLTVGYTTDIEADDFSASLTPDFSLEYLKTMTVTGDFTLNVPTGNGHGEYYLTIDSSGPYTLTKGTNVTMMDSNVTMLADKNYILNIHRYSATNAIAQLVLSEGSIAPNAWNAYGDSTSGSGPFEITGTTTTRQLNPDGDGTRDLGSLSPSVLRYAQLNCTNAEIHAGDGTVDSRQGFIAGQTLPEGGAASTAKLTTFGASFPASGRSMFCCGTAWNYSGTGTAEIRCTESGAFAQGTALTLFSPYASLIESAGAGSFTQGYSYAYAAAATIKATNSGSFVQGFAKNSVMQSTGLGSFTQGYTNGAGGLQATNTGAFAQGKAAGPITAAKAGSFAQGNTRALGSLFSNGPASFVQGYAFEGSVQATGDASFAQGLANDGGDILAVGDAGFAQGIAFTNNIEANGDGSFAHGDATTGAIIADAVNSTQLGPGTNITPNSLQVSTTIAMNGDNGDLRFDGTLIANIADVSSTPYTIGNEFCAAVDLNTIDGDAEVRLPTSPVDGQTHMVKVATVAQTNGDAVKIVTTDGSTIDTNTGAAPNGVDIFGDDSLSLTGLWFIYVTAKTNWMII